MNDQSHQIVSGIVQELEQAWNAADGEAFARPYTIAFHNTQAT